eukprot:TRINITY_DN55082_c0_g1_i1.p1 TRINITY_DN55082_c0_g1~~TRINITY_DN55082_c0_g1_i1.p1  ORF type:complete len:485 (-),score=44.90 TRINITY_DN55082_c0_g1_i1:311-1765(-)
MVSGCSRFCRMKWLCRSSRVVDESVFHRIVATEQDNSFFNIQNPPKDAWQGSDVVPACNKLEESSEPLPSSASQQLTLWHHCSWVELPGRLWRIALVVFALSVSSFACASLFFGVVTHCPREDLSDTCLKGATQTELGQRCSIRALEVWVSAPKLLLNGSMMIIYSWMLLGQRASPKFLVGAVIQAIGAIAAVTATLLVKAPILQPIVAWGSVLLMVICTFAGHEYVHSDTWRPCFRKLTFYVCVASLFAIHAVAINIGVVVGNKFSVGWVVLCVSIFNKFVDLACREIFKLVEVPTWICTLLLFAYQTQSHNIIRRRITFEASFESMVGAAAAAAVVEAIFYIISVMWASYRFQHHTQNNRSDKAIRHLNMFLTALVSDMIAEHVAMSAAAATSLFVDTRVFSIAVNSDWRAVLVSWGLQVLFELLADSVGLILLFMMLPVKSLRTDILLQPSVVAWVSCCICMVIVIGLQNSLTSEHFRCAT